MSIQGTTKSLNRQSCSLSHIVDPASQEYAALDRDGKAKALIAAAAAFDEAMKKAESAAQVLPAYPKGL